MKHIISIITIGLLQFSSGYTLAQFTIKAQPLTIGDPIPDEVWNMPLQIVNHPEGQKTITLSDYKDKLIILDFWATWCVPCVKSLYKLDTLQGQFNDDLVIIPTTYEDADKVAPFFDEKGWSLPTAVSETILKGYFPYQSIPHQIWIKDGEVVAIAGHQYATAEYIGKVLTGEEVDFEYKIEVELDKFKPLFLGGNGGDGSNMHYQSVISGRLSANISGGARPNPNEILLYNRTVEGLFIEAIRNNGNLHLSELNAKGYILYEIPDSLRYRVSSSIVLATDNDSLKKEWLNSNSYCYNLVLPKGAGYADVGRRMYQDLNDFFGIYLNLKVSYEEREVKALALVKLDTFKGISTKGGTRATRYNADEKELLMYNAPLSALTSNISSSRQRASRSNRELTLLPVVDETGIEGNVDLIVKADLLNINEFREGLAEYGLDLVEKISMVKMIVFKSADKQDGDSQDLSAKVDE